MTISTGDPRTSRRREATRARLLDAAFDVFAARGFGQTSVEDVCRAAGFTRGAFYSNFDSLHELFFALYEQRAAAAAERVATVLTSAGGIGSTPSNPSAPLTPSTPSTVSALVERVVAALVVDRDWALLKTDVVLHAARNPQLAGALAEHRDAVRRALADTLAPWLGAGRMPSLPAPLREPGELARAVIAVHDAAMLELLADPRGLDVRAWLADLLTALLDH